MDYLTPAQRLEAWNNGMNELWEKLADIEAAAQQTTQPNAS